MAKSNVSGAPAASLASSTLDNDSIGEGDDSRDSNMGLELVDSKSNTSEPDSAAAAAVMELDAHSVEGALAQQQLDEDEDDDVDDDPEGIGSTQCLLCDKTFSSIRMLHQHNQNFHMDKSFVCEICGKAFRFRSNLAEHRSVHTAVKPFVCKICGKCSRLKGNLTKHILKHHKTQQIEAIGKDDIIIKKGKKSIKDPAAIEFLEQSMMVLQSPPQHPSAATSATNHELANGNGAHHHTAAHNSYGVRRSVGSTGGKRSSAHLTSNTGSLVADPKAFLLSLGLDEGSIDLGKGATNSITNDDGGGGLVSAVDSLRGSANSSKLSGGVSEFHSTSEFDRPGMDGDEIEREEPLEEGGYRAEEAMDTATGDDLMDQTSAALAAACRMLLFGNLGSSTADAGGESTTDAASSIEQSVENVIKECMNVNTTGGPSKSPANSKGLSPTTGSSFISSQPLHNSRRSSDRLLLAGRKSGTPTGGASSSFLTPPKATALGGSGSVARVGTQCPECGKHLRKARDLITHLAAIHRVAIPTGDSNGVRYGTSQSNNSNPTGNGAKREPHSSSGATGLAMTDNLANAISATLAKFPQPMAGTASSSSNGSLHGGADMAGQFISSPDLANELRQLRKMLEEIRNSVVGSLPQVEDALENMDRRMNKLEKQLEMALNSIYTLVQLQSGINNQVSRFRDETSDQLKSVTSLLSNSNGC